MSNCKPEQVSDNLFRCSVCGFEYHSNFSKNCNTQQAQPIKCKHTGEIIEYVDKKFCNCSSKSLGVTLNHCDKYGVKCGLLNLLKYNKRKELEEEGVKNCSICEDRFL